MEGGSGRLRPADAEDGAVSADVLAQPAAGDWLTAVLSLVLLVGLALVLITGLASSAAWDPGFAVNSQAQHRGLGPLNVQLFAWPARPAWLYAVTQGVHVSVGLALVPVVAVKHWSVLPRLFTWPPVRSPAHAAERLIHLLLLAGIYFELATGLMFIEYWFPLRFDLGAGLL